MPDDKSLFSMNADYWIGGAVAFMASGIMLSAVRVRPAALMFAGLWIFAGALVVRTIRWMRA